MAKGRMLLNRICESDKVHDLSCDTARLLYTWMLSYLDKNGCFRAKPILVKNKIFPLREDISKDDVKGWLNEMEILGLIVRYCDNKYLFYPDFFEKQPKIQKDREGDSGIPEPNQEQIKSKSRPNPTQIKLKEVKLSKDKRSNNGGEIFFQCEHDDKFQVSKESKEIFCSTYGLTEEVFLKELNKMSTWLYSNPNKKKTNYKRFVNNWLNNGGKDNGASKGDSKEGDKKLKGDRQPYPIDIQ